MVRHLAPADTPRTIVDVLNRVIVHVIQLPEVRKQWETLGGEAMPLTSEEFDDASGLDQLRHRPAHIHVRTLNLPAQGSLAMRLKIFPWLGQRFISLSWEGNGEGTVEDETRGIFAGFEQRLGQFGLSLDHVARTRMFTRDMNTWTESNATRASILKGKARSVSSSHIWPDHLGDRARVSIDLIAMVPPPSPEEKVLKEYDPPTIVLRRMNWGGLLFLSGVTDMTHVTFDEQFPVIIKRLTDTLADGAGSWDKVRRADFFLHHEETLEHLQESFARAVNVDIPDIGYTFVGTRQGKRLEIELTAKVS